MLTGAFVPLLTIRCLLLWYKMNQRCLLELLKASPELPLASEDTGQSETPVRAGSPERPVNLCSFSHQSEKVFVSLKLEQHQRDNVSVL